MTFSTIEHKVLPQFFPAHWLRTVGQIHHLPFPSRVRIGYVLRDHGRYSYLLESDFQKLGVTSQCLHEAALRNLADLPSGEITIASVPGGAEGYISARDNFAAVRILLPHVRAQFHTALGNAFLFVIPCRDDCFCWSTAQPADRQKTHCKMALDDFTSRDHNLSPDVIRASSDGFHLHHQQLPE